MVGCGLQVLIDDQLLVTGGKWRGYTATRLVYAHTINRDDPSEPGGAMWVPLIEKVIAAA